MTSIPTPEFDLIFQTLNKQILDGNGINQTLGLNDQTGVQLIAEYRRSTEQDQQTSPNKAERISNAEPTQPDFAHPPPKHSAQESALLLNQQLSEASHTLQQQLRFTVQSPIGEGSFGLTWKVVDLDLKRAVAVKTFKGPLQQALQACQDEVRFVGRLDHPAIPTIYDVGVTQTGQPFVVMKLLEGESLSKIISRLNQGDQITHQRYSYIQRIELILQLLRVLQSVHDQGILHRDIKPENILVSSDGHLSLLDWGCAIELSEVTQKSQICGTPLFMPPEQVLGKGLTPASDLFAAAGVAYELLSLSPPGPSERTVLESLKRIPTYQPPQVDKLHHPAQGYVPSEFYPIIMRALARDSQKRPQSAEEMSIFLRNALDGHIEVVCPRTLIKSKISIFTRWLDHNPYRAVPTIILSLSFTALLLISLGVLIGAWFS